MLIQNNKPNNIPEEKFVPGEVIVGLKEGAQFRSVSEADFPGLELASVEDLLAAGSGKTAKRLRTKREILLLKLKEKTEASVAEAIKVLAANPNVAYAHPNHIGTVLKVPNDPKYGEQYGLQKIQAEEAWEITTGSKSVQVALPDSGCEYTHPDLGENLAVDLGYNFVDDKVDSFDDYGHGTFTGGILAANTNNGVGIAGVCWDLTVVPLKLIDEEGYGEEADFVRAMAFAEANGFKVVSASLAYYSRDLALKEAIEGYSGLLVMGAGNLGLNNDGNSTWVYPAAWSLENMLVVCATDEHDERPEWSNYGATKVHIAAPGEQISSLWIGNDYLTESGTSASTPFAAGVAALMLSIKPDLTTAQMKETLMNTVDVIPALADSCITSGRLNAYSALQYVQQNF